VPLPIYIYMKVQFLFYTVNISVMKKRVKNFQIVHSDMHYSMLSLAEQSALSWFMNVVSKRS
jgi:hypothetical protein